MLVGCNKQQGLVGERIYTEVQIESWVNDKGRFVKLKTEAEETKRKREELRRLEEERRRLELEEQKKKNLINKLGYEPVKIKEVTFHVTYFYAANNSLQGGMNDMRGVPLKSHNYPIVALPQGIPYGSKIEFDEPVRGAIIYTNVDTGGAIKWINDSSLKVDVFVPEATSYDWLIRNTENVKVKGKIYYK